MLYVESLCSSAIDYWHSVGGDEKGPLDCGAQPPPVKWSPIEIKWGPTANWSLNFCQVLSWTPVLFRMMSVTLMKCFVVLSHCYLILLLTDAITFYCCNTVNCLERKHIQKCFNQYLQGCIILGLPVDHRKGGGSISLKSHLTIIIAHLLKHIITVRCTGNLIFF